MKTIAGISANTYLSIAPEGKLAGLAELVIILAEPQYQADTSGFVKTQRLTEMRIHVSEGGVRELIKHLGELQDDIAELESRASLKPKED